MPASGDQWQACVVRVRGAKEKGGEAGVGGQRSGLHDNAEGLDGRTLTSTPSKLSSLISKVVGVLCVSVRFHFVSV